jgi:hypothetical protein
MGSCEEIASIACFGAWGVEQVEICPRLGNRLGG